MTASWSDLFTLALAFVAGILSGAFSMGGQVLMKPGIRLLGTSALDAVGTTVPMILPTVASASIRYLRAGFVDAAAVRWAAPGGALAAFAGSLAAPRVPGRGHVLQVATAGLMLTTAVRTFRGSDPPKIAPREGDPRDRPDSGAAATGRRDGVTAAARRGRARIAAVGSLAGALSGLLGVGGGVLMVPAFNELVRLPLRSAIATSLVCAGVFAVPATLTHAWVGTIEWRTAILLIVGAVPGARFGAWMSTRSSDRRLRVAVAVMIGAVGLSYGLVEIAALMRRA